jgi:hypothetical protein
VELLAETASLAAQTASSIVIFVFYPSAPFFVCTSIKKEHRPYLMRALLSSLEAESVEPMPLVGKHAGATLSPCRFLRRRLLIGRLQMRCWRS